MIFETNAFISNILNNIQQLPLIKKIVTKVYINNNNYECYYNLYNIYFSKSLR